MPRTASPVVFPIPHRGPYTDFEKSFMENPLHEVWYERTIMHWNDHELDWFYQEQIVVQQKDTGQFYWPHNNELVPVKSLKEVMSEYFFQVSGEYQDQA